MDWLLLLEVSLAGLGTGGLYALTALAFVIVYKATKVVNLAIGEMLMMGAYFFLALATSMQLPWWLAIAGAVVGGGLLGAVVERLAIRPMLGKNPIATFMVTVGLASVLVGTVELVWTPDPRSLPEFIPGDPIFIGSAFVAPKLFYSFLAAAVLITITLLVFWFWRGGVALRATASDQTAACAMGINVPRVFSVAWSIAGMTAALAGIFVGAIGGISSTMGQFGLSVLVVVIFGGLDSVLGALVGGITIGLLEAWAGTYLGGEYRMLTTFSLLLLILSLRPHGLFGSAEIERL